MGVSNEASDVTDHVTKAKRRKHQHTALVNTALPFFKHKLSSSLLLNRQQLLLAFFTDAVNPFKSMAQQRGVNSLQFNQDQSELRSISFSVAFSVLDVYVII